MPLDGTCIQLAQSRQLEDLGALALLYAANDEGSEFMMGTDYT